MQLRHDPTFFWATRRLPRDVRPAVHALYGYVRGADEIVDGAGRPASAEARRARARRLGGARSSAGCAAGRSTHPVIAALVDAGRAPRPAARRAARVHGLDARRLRRRCGSDLAASSTAYMDGSAGAVGRIMAPLLGVPERARGRLGAARASRSS